jgi:hypothetical protein
VGTTAASLVALALLVGTARADDCTGDKDGSAFATCFDLGNRLSLVAGTTGFGGGIALRHTMKFDDDHDVEWKMEHGLAEATYAGFEDRLSGVVYRGRYLRHARDGHIVLPLGRPQKIFLPFDIGALAEIGTIAWRPDSDAQLGVVHMAALVELGRSRGFGTMFAVGPSARWQIDLHREPVGVAEHVVSPFTTGLAMMHLETGDGLWSSEVRVEAGTAWHSTKQWTPEVRAEGSLERIVLAINDRPIALVAGASYDSASGETVLRVGLRISLVVRDDPRVRFDAISAR